MSKMVSLFQRITRILLFKYIIVGFGILSLIVPILLSFFNAIDVDSAVILTEMERIAEGYVPYKTLHLNYPPLFFYINVALKRLFNVPFGCYPFYLAVHYVFTFVSAWMLYLISRKFRAPKSISLLAVWLFVMITHWTQGNIVLFELPSICFGLIAMYASIHYSEKNCVHYLWIGVVAACSLLVKQFGLGFCLLVICLIVIYSEDRRLSRIGLFILGYLTPLALCLVIWGKDIVNAIILNGYGTNTAELAGYDVSFGHKCSQIIGNLWYYLRRVCPIVIYSALLVPSAIGNIRKGGDEWKQILICYLGILGFALQFWFVAGGLHYLLYMIPFAVLLLPSISVLSNGKIMRVLAILSVVVTTLLAIYSTYHNRVYKGIINRGKESQCQISSILETKIDSGKKVWIPHGGIEYLYYFNNLIVPNMATIGYATGPLEVTPEKQWAQIKSADYVICFKRVYPYEYSFSEEVREWLSQFSVESLDRDGEILLYDMTSKQQY